MRCASPPDNVVAGFGDWKASFAYVAAMLLLGNHLFHGGWSMFQSLGVSHPKYTPLLKRATAAAAVLITAGNVSIPLAVLLGLVK